MQLFTLCSVGYDKPGEEKWEATGRYDQNGDAILKRSCTTIPPHTVIDIDDEVVIKELLDAEAARPLEPNEALVFERGVSPSLPTQPEIQGRFPSPQKDQP